MHLKPKLPGKPFWADMFYFFFFSPCFSFDGIYTIACTYNFFSVITLHIAVFDALNAYAFSSSKMGERKGKEKWNLRMNYTHFFFLSFLHCKADDILGGDYGKRCRNEGAIYDMRTILEMCLREMCIVETHKISIANAFLLFPSQRSFKMHPRTKAFNLILLNPLSLQLLL